MTVPSSVYRDIIDWASSQKNYEAAHGRPAPLNQNQRKALLGLHQIIKPGPPVPPVPEIGHQDWVSLLYRYRQANPGTRDIVFTEQAAAEATVHQPCWNVFVSLEEHPEGSFPLAPVPSFPRKKDARQYAAKCAVEWLKAKKHMPDNGVDVTFSKQKTKPVVASSSSPSYSSSSSSPPSPSSVPSPKRQKLSHAAKPTAYTATAVDHQQQRQPPTVAPQHGALIKREPITEPSGSDDDDEEEEEAVHQVVQLCKELGFPPPTYKISREMGNSWRGYAEFDRVSSGADLPVNVGEVSNIHGGQTLVREAIAAEVLKLLRKVMASRKATYDELIQSIGSQGNNV